jgi:hypothetical protein
LIILLAQTPEANYEEVEQTLGKAQNVSFAQGESEGFRKWIMFEVGGI